MDKTTKKVYNRGKTREREGSMRIYDISKDMTNFESDKPLELHGCDLQSHKLDFLVHRPNGRLDWHIIFVIEGEVTLKYEGKEYVLKKRDFVVYPPNAPQEYLYRSDKAPAVFWIHFSGTEARSIMEKCGLTGGIYHSRDSAEIRALFPPMVREYHIRSPFWELRGAGLTAQLICELARSVSLAGRIDDSVAELAEHIQKNYASDIDMSAFAAQAGFSRNHFDYLFRTQIGMPPHQYLLDVRIQKASWLLRHTTLPIAKVAEQVGFSDPFYFSRLYKKKYGLSPKITRTQSLHLLSTLSRSHAQGKRSDIRIPPNEASGGKA